MKHKRLLFILVSGACIVLATQAWAVQNAPTDVQAAPGDKSAAVSFQAASADNGSSLTGYTVTSNPSGGVDSNAGSTSLIHVVTGLANGTAYTFTVKATNSLNETSSPSSASNSVTPSATVLAAYAGTWNVSGMITGADSPWGQACVQTVNADGTFTSSCTDSYGQTSSESCSGWLFPYGLTATCTPSLPFSNFLCYGDASALVTVCTATINDGSGSSYLHIVTKQASTPYSTSSDLAGTWNLQGLKTKSGSFSWDQADISIYSGGNYQGTATNSDGTTAPLSGVFSLSTSGEVGCISGCDSSDTFFMDAGKNLAAGLEVYSTDDIELVVLSKKSGSYTLADLAGEWIGSQLKSDGVWSRTIAQIYGDGSYTSSQVNSDGTTSTDFGNLAISQGGVVSCASTQPAGSGCKANFVMDAGKTVMTGARTHNSGAAYSITVLTKTGSFLWQNAISTGGGWYYLTPFGAFNKNASPWIYHQALGWLYPIGTSTDSIWFWDPRWNGHGGWWWTGSSFFPWLYSATENEWLYYDAVDSTPGARWFFTAGGQASVH